MRFASPHRMRPQVFSTSRRFAPPRACRPCFMPDPLMGLCPSEPSPLTQPFAVSGAAPLLTFGTHRETTPPPTSARAETRAPTDRIDTQQPRTYDRNRSPRITAQRHRCPFTARRSTRLQDRCGHILSRGAEAPRVQTRRTAPTRNAETPLAKNITDGCPLPSPAPKRQPHPPTAVAARFRAQRRNASLIHRPPWLPASEPDTEIPAPSTDHRGSLLPNPIPKYRLRPPTTVAARFRSQHRSAESVHRPPWQLASRSAAETPVPSTVITAARFRAQRRNASLIHRPPELPASGPSTEVPNSSTDRSTSELPVPAPKCRARPPAA
jgi:hypothetical protein